MNLKSSGRVLLWPFVAAFLALALFSAAVAFRRSAAAPAPAEALPPADAPPFGVVCFGTVDLEHGVTSLDPLQPGRVAEVLVHENQQVAAGTELLRLDDAAARSRLDEAEAALELSSLQLQEARELPEQYRGRVKQQEAVVEASRARLEAARQVLAQRRKPTQLPPQAAEIELAASEVQVRELEALERAEAQRLAELQAQDADAAIRRAEYEVKVAEARRNQARLALGECHLKAPQAGMVLRILVGPGDLVGGGSPTPGQPAVLFAADGPQVIRATVEQEFAPRIKPGAAAEVQDDADTSTSWSGKVERIAGWYSQRRAVLHDPSELSDVRTLECVIVLEPGQPRLRLGQGVRVFIGTR